jgi:hypothetical protein
MIDAMTHCRRPMTSLLLLLAGAVTAGLLVGGSVAFGLCSVVFLVHHSG